ncbi:uncharacterized protein LOC116553804 [Sapajus apella]|uniref:Uncharacterized protein LOC116553804 n=1 Tax=Sapajus apella TaxID=9515 RepID=A0A6J3I4J7_SAPAP|nr:uncharacterized protein LOC116553804 [Sapajus apella]
MWPERVRARLRRSWKGRLGPRVALQAVEPHVPESGVRRELRVVGKANRTKLGSRRERGRPCEPGCGTGGGRVTVKKRGWGERVCRRRLGCGPWAPQAERVAACLRLARVSVRVRACARGGEPGDPRGGGASARPRVRERARAELTAEAAGRPGYLSRLVLGDCAQISARRRRRRDALSGRRGAGQPDPGPGRGSGEQSMEERAGRAVLKLSLRGDTAAAAALLPLLCLPMDMHCKADPFSAMHRCQDAMVIFPCLCLGDALKTKRGSEKKSKSGRERAAQPSRWARQSAALLSALEATRLASHSTLRILQPTTWPGGQQRAKNEGERTKGKQMPKLGRKEEKSKQGKGNLKKKVETMLQRKREKGRKERVILMKLEFNLYQSLA